MTVTERAYPKNSREKVVKVVTPKKKRKTKSETDAGKEVRQYLMKCNVTAEIPAGDQSLEQLDKALRLASARLTYAMEQREYWLQQVNQRGRVFSRANTAYRQKKYGFTNEQIRDNPPTSKAVWSYAE